MRARISSVIFGLVSIVIGLGHVAVNKAAFQANSSSRELPKFRVDPAWPKIPNNWQFGQVASVSIDAQDHVWVLQRPGTLQPDEKPRAAPPLLEFDPAGNFVQAWGGPSPGYEWPESEHGVYVDPKGYVWIGGNGAKDHQILKFTKSGKFVMQIGHAGQSKGNADTQNLNQPADTFVYAKTNELFVADGYGNRRVIVFDADTGKFKRMWGAFGNKPSDEPPNPALPDADEKGAPQFVQPVHAARVSNDGLVYVSDRGGKRVQVFTVEGKYLTQVFIGRECKAPDCGNGTTAASTAFSADREQRFLYVGNRSQAKVMVLNRKTLEILDSFGRWGSAPGEFGTLHHMAADSKGNLYVTEVTPLRPENRRIQKFVFMGMSSQARSAATPGTLITAWSTSQQALGDARISNATVRMIARVTIPGDAVRIRLDNTFGTEPVTIGEAFVGHRIQGALLAAGSNRRLTFNGASDVLIPAGGTVSSDLVSLKVQAQQDLAVSLYVSGSNVRPSQHTNAAVTSYRSADGSGNVAADEARGPFSLTTTSLWWLKAIEVQTTAPASAVVMFGDSITDGTCSTLDAHDRWEDVLSVRLGLERESRSPKAVLNEGIGGNTVTREGLTPPPDSTPGLERLDRDVLSHHGVTDVVVFMGTNDIRRGATAANVIAGLTTIIQRTRAKGHRVLGVSIIPRHNVAPSANNTGWNAEKTRIRNEVNQWIRTKAPFDDVLDFDRVVRDPASPDLLYPPFNCGDGIHPSPLGYYEMGRSIELNLLRRR